MPNDQTDLRDLNYLIASAVISGHVDDLHATSVLNMLQHNEREGFRNIEYRNFPAVLVEQGRDAIVNHAIAQKYHAILFMDADMTGFPPSAFIQLLEDAFIKVPHADAVGAYCTLKGPPHLPTIDTGSGTWESHYPGGGLMPVIRTGGAFLLAKISAFQKFNWPKGPWFRARNCNASLAALHDVDNLARCWNSGENPFYDTPEWLALVMEAKKRGGWGEHAIGEDSGFCDRLKAAGGHIYVDTDIPVGHVTKKVLTWQDHKEFMDKQEKNLRMAVGVMG